MTLMLEELARARHSLLYVNTGAGLDAGPLLDNADAISRRQSGSAVVDLMIKEIFARYWHKTLMGSKKLLQ